MGITNGVMKQRALHKETWIRCELSHPLIMKVRLTFRAIYITMFTKFYLKIISQSNQDYILGLQLEGSGGGMFSGDLGKTVCVGEDGTSFTFKPSHFQNNQGNTNVESGQIPVLMYSK